MATAIERWVAEHHGPALTLRQAKWWHKAITDKYGYECEIIDVESEAHFKENGWDSGYALRVHHGIGKYPVTTVTTKTSGRVLLEWGH